MTKHTPTPWYLEKFNEFECSRDFRLYGNKKPSGCGYRIMDTIFHEDSPLGRDMAHAVKCVNEHEALQEQVEELVDALNVAVNRIKYLHVYCEERHQVDDEKNRLPMLEVILAKHTTKEAE